MATETKKKGPGRPRKTPAKPAPTKRGIISVPDKPNNIVEFQYDTADNIKDLSSYWKTLNVEYVAFQFVPTCMLIFIKSYRDDKWVRQTFHGKKMVSYYCHETTTALVRFKDIDLIFQKLDKECTLFTLAIDLKKREREMDMVLFNNSEIPEFFKIEQVVDSEVIKKFSGVFNDDAAYPLHLQVPSKWFKKTISDVKNFEDKWTISKYPGGPVQFNYNSANGHVTAISLPPTKMIVQDTIPSGSPFAVTVMANVLRPTTSAMLADTILLKASCDGRRMWLTALMDDGAIVVDILCNIDGYKPESKAP